MERFIDVFGLKKSKKLPDDELYVMLMLQRASEGSEPAKADCEDPMIKAACLLDSDKCPAECKGSDEKEDNTVVKSGDLAVTAKAAEGRKALIGWVSDLDTITFKTSEDVTISSITLERYGYSTIDDVETVQLEDEDGNIIADAKEPNSKGQVKLTLKKDYKTVDGTFKATVVVKVRELGKDISAETGNPDAYADDVNPNGANTYAGLKNGSTLGFKVIAAESTAKNLNLDDYSPYTYDLVNYAGSKVQFSTRNSAEKTYNFEAGKLYEVVKFRVKAPSDAAILIKGFTLTEDDNNLEADKYAKEVTVTVNGKEVKGLKWNINKDDELVVSFDEIEVAGKETATIAVNMSFNEEFDNFGKASTYYISKLSNFNAIDKKTESRVSQADGYTIEGIQKHAANWWTTYIFNGGKIKIAGTKLGTVNAAAGASNVKVAEGNITITEPLRGSARVKVKSNAAAIDEIRLVIDGEEYDGSKGADGVYTFKWLEIEKSGKVELRVDVKSEVDGEPAEWTIEFAASLNSNSFFPANATEAQLADRDNSLLKYDESGKKVAYDEVSGSLSISSIKIQAARASLDNKNTKEVELVKDENNRKIIFEGTYTAKKGAVTLKNFVITKASGTAVDGKPTFYVTIDKEEYDANWSVNDAEAKWDIDDIEVADGKSVSVVVEIEATPTEGSAVYNIELSWEDEDNNPAGKADEDTAKVKVVEQGTLEITDASAKKTVLLKSDRTVAKFRIKPSKSGGDDIILKSMWFTLTDEEGGDGTWGDLYNNLKVDIDGDTYTKGGQLEIEESNLTNGEAMIKPDVKVPSAWLVVTVTLKSELEVTNETPDETFKRYFTLEEVNTNTNVATTFSKYWVPAIIKNLKQEKSGDTTRYTFDMENDGSDSVSNMKFYTNIENDADKCVPTETLAESNTIEGADATTHCNIVSHKDSVSSTDNKMSAINGNKATSVVAISYEVGDQTVIIKKSEFEDFFDLGKDDLMVYSNSNN